MKLGTILGFKVWSKKAVTLTLQERLRKTEPEMILVWMDLPRTDTRVANFNLQEVSAERKK